MGEAGKFKLRNTPFEELFHNAGLEKLDYAFLTQLKKENSTLHDALIAYRYQKKCFTSLAVSELLLATAPFLERFIIEFFDIELEAEALQVKTLSENPIAAFKTFFILRRAKKQIAQSHQLPSFTELYTWLKKELTSFPLKTDDLELSIALLANTYLSEPEKYPEHIEKLTQWCIQAIATEEGKKKVAGWSSFHLPERIDFEKLVSCHAAPEDSLGRLTVEESALHLRDGFGLTDLRMNAREVQNEVNYCIYCHDHDGDFCSKGFPVKKGDPTQGFKQNALEVTLTGCPLEEKISEMNVLKRDGASIAALAVVMIDNPMCPATGHRICNDCMKSCIYQKQTPVNVPQIETRVLTDVLHLPWGVEIYDLLTRWNPLREKQWIMKPYNNLKIMIAGMGPAGFTLAHHLLLEGFAVVGFDGLKIEPLSEKWTREPIYHFSDLIEKLDERVMAGFGGVAEYGITVRWDKNFLKLIYISLMRKPYFQVFGSARFGGTITIDDAFEMGFDHFAIGVGAGLPKALPIPGSLAPGMRQANDFLMSLQLGNAAKKESLTNLQVRLPAVVIGGGLTGVDTATEVQAYYIAQVEKILLRYEALVTQYDEEKILKECDMASIEILDEFLSHGRMIRKERERAKEKNEMPNFIQFIRQWGGVTIVYRRHMTDSPAYINNHEELQKALEEGVYYLEALEPISVSLNQFGHTETLVCHQKRRKNGEWEATVEEVRVPARAIFVATGTQPNVAYEFEYRGTLHKQGFQYYHYEEENGELISPPGIAHCKETHFGPFTSYNKNNKRVSLIGDTHPVFHGSVVKAIASGFRTYPKIVAHLKNKLSQPGNEKDYAIFAEKMRHYFTATLLHSKRHAKNILELTIHAPLAAKHFQPGQFYRLQNYETLAPKIKKTSLQMEPLALMAADVDREKETLTFMIVENGATTTLSSLLREGEPVSLMGPTGVRAKISSSRETVLIMGNQLSIPLLISYGKALREAGNRVMYVGCFSSPDDIYAKKIIEKIADVIIWVTSSTKKISPSRPQDYSVEGNAIDILVRYAEGKLSTTSSHPVISLLDVDRIYLIHDSVFLQHFQEARKNQLKPFFIKNPKVIGSVYSTMQCMLKGVCAQCLQWQIDPETGKRTKAVFACSWQHQPLELIDFDNVHERQVQNRLQEKLNQLYVNSIC